MTDDVYLAYRRAKSSAEWLNTIKRRKQKFH